MSGIEVAGIVLGAIPIILAGLQFYAEGVRVTTRYLKYEKGVEDLISQLKTEHTIYSNSIELILDGVVKHKEIKDFLANPAGDRWKEPIFTAKLRKQLGSSCSSYVDTINHLVTILERFKTRLRLDAFGKPQFTDKNTFKEHYKRLKFSVNKADYKELMAELHRTNRTLHLLTTQTSTLAARQVARRSQNQHTPNFRHIKDQAVTFHSALHRCWKCDCQTTHSVNLRLEPRIDDVFSEDEETGLSTRGSFHVLFRYEHGNPQDVNHVKPWTWEEAHARIKYESQAPLPDPIQKRGSSKGVRFAKQTMPQAVQAALKPQPNLQPIEDLCSAISTLQMPQRDVCFSMLADEIAKQKSGVLLITPVKQYPSDTALWSVSSLRAILSDSNFARQDRLKLAITLASSVLQLHETPWLDEDWGKDSILFVERPGQIHYDQPFVSQNMDAPSQPRVSTASSLMSCFIRNQTLYALGVALIELYYRKPISDLHQDIDGPQNTGDILRDSMTEFKTADRLADALFSEAGAKYSDAVRRCIRCDFDQRASSLEDKRFQGAVYQGVVAQLQEDYDSLFQVSPTGD